MECPIIVMPQHPQTYSMAHVWRKRSAALSDCILSIIVDRRENLYGRRSEKHVRLGEDSLFALAPAQ
jgi:hypothetical protein